MDWYLKLLIYLFSTGLSFIVIYQIDFNKFMRIGKAQFATLVWVLISLALGYLVGSLFVEIGEQLQSI